MPDRTKSRESLADAQAGRPPLRARIWKLMLRVESLHAEDYLKWVAMGPSDVSTKSE